MTERRLKVFLAVVQHRSFTRAAEALYMTQPTVTFQIKQLEDHFNTRLLDRSSAGVVPTPAGEVVLAHAGRILAASAELDERVADATGQMRGPLHVGSSASLAATAMPPVLRAFSDAYPKIPVCLRIIDSASIEQEVLDRRLEVGVLAVSALPQGLEGTLVGEQELVVICPPAHPLAGAERIEATRLVGHAYVAREPGAATRRAFEEYLAAQGFDVGRLNLALEIGSADALCAVVAAGCGFALATRASVRREVEAGRLVAVSLAPPLVRPVMIIQLADRYRSRLMSTFVDLAARKLRESCR